MTVDEEVPVPAYPFHPTVIATQEGGGAIRQSQGGANSLGSLSINDTPTITPSEMAWKSYRNCSNEIKGKYGKLLTDFCRYMEMCDNSGFSAEGIAVGSRCKSILRCWTNTARTTLASARCLDRCLTDGIRSAEPHGSQRCTPYRIGMRQIG